MTIYSKLEYFVQKRLCIYCSADVATFHRHRYLVPSYNLFQTGILCSKKAMHLLQRRCRRIPHALLVSTLVPYLSWGTIFVCRPYFMLFLSTNKFVAGQIKTLYYPPHYHRTAQNIHHSMYVEYTDS